MPRALHLRSLPPISGGQPATEGWTDARDAHVWVQIGTSTAGVVSFDGGVSLGGRSSSGDLSGYLGTTLRYDHPNAEVCPPDLAGPCHSHALGIGSATIRTFARRGDMVFADVGPM